MAERRFTAKPASPGLATGPLFSLPRQAATTSEDAPKRRASGDASVERAALDQAIAKAMADLEALAAVAAGDGAEILAFQIEMLGDPALVEDALPAIGGGEDAITAWRVALHGQIAAYDTADDDYFRARASDLRDLRDRVVRVLDGVSLELPDLEDGAILLADDLAPSQFLALSTKGLGAIALIEGSASSHVAILARGRGLPMIVGLGPYVSEAATGDRPIEAILDGDEGALLLDPNEATRETCRRKLKAAKVEARQATALRKNPAMTADGQRIELMVNVDDPDAVDDAILEAADGVGLLRSEFLLIGREDLPSEADHLRVYRDLMRRLNGKPLIVRTLDIGGDKQHPGLDLPTETNPFLGLRGIRLCLDRPALFHPQIRALLTAAAAGGALTGTSSLAGGGSLKVMLPMVSAQAEIDETKALFVAALGELRREGVRAAMPSIGIMVETPAAAIAADRLDADFFSIGSNDLIQYALAAARDAGGRVRDLLDPGHPAIERLIRNVVEHGRASAREVSLCGDMASDPAWLTLLLRAGVRRLSVAPAAFDRVKLALSTIDLGEVGQAENDTG